MPPGLTTTFNQQALNLKPQVNPNADIPKQLIATSLKIDKDMKEGIYGMAVVAFEDQRDGSGLGFATFFRLDVQN